MAINSPKHMEEILVKAHVREGRAVKSFKRLQEVALKDVKTADRINTKEFFDEYDNVAGSIFDKDGEIRDTIPDDKLELYGKTLFTMSTESGVDDVIFSKRDALKTIFED